MNQHSSLKFPCSSCGTNLKAPSEMFGNSINCPNCQASLIVPIPEQGVPAPAKTEVLLGGSETTEASANPVRIWNPGHAASLTVLLCPPLGPVVHAMNWKSLAQPDLSRRSWVWAGIITAAILTFLVLSASFPEAAGASAAAVVLLVFAWYFMLGKKQITAAAQQRGAVSFRPLLPVVGAGVILTGILAGTGYLAVNLGDRKLIERAAAPLVSEILSNALGVDAAECLEVKLGEKIAKDFYRATATLNNGNILNVTIRRNDDQILVQLAQLPAVDSFSTPVPVDSFAGDTTIDAESPDAAAAPVPTPAAGEAKDAALELGLPRSGATDFETMIRHYGFEGIGGYQIQKPTGEGLTGTYRDKEMVLAVGGAYEVGPKGQAGVSLIQHRLEGTAMPTLVLVDAPNLDQRLFAESDYVRFVGIQTGVLDLGAVAPTVRLLGIQNVTTNQFYNFEPTSLPLGEVPGLKEAKQARVAAEARKEAEEAKTKQVAEKEEAERRAEAERKYREHKEWLDSLEKKKQPATGSGDDPFASDGSNAKADANLPADLAAAKAELEKVTSTIASERARWQEALALINRLTVNKTKPVVEGSTAYHQCLAASKVIHEVEQGAQGLKDRKAALEARVKELEK